MNVLNAHELQVTLVVVLRIFKACTFQHVCLCGQLGTAINYEHFFLSDRA